MNFHFNKKKLNKIEEKRNLNFNNMNNKRETKKSLKSKVDELLSENEKLKNEIDKHKINNNEQNNNIKPQLKYILPRNFKENLNQHTILIQKHTHKEKEGVDKDNVEEDGIEKKDGEKKDNKKRNKKEDVPIKNDFNPFINDHHEIPPIIVTLIGVKRQNEDDEEEKKKKKEESFFDYFKNVKELYPIDKEIKTLQDFIDLGKSYNEKDEKRYVINLKSLNKCVPVLEELSNMIGMKSVKKMILDLLFYRLQNLENEDDNEDFEEKPALKKQKIHNLPSFMMPPQPPGGCCDSEEDESKMNIYNMETLNKDKSSLKNMYHMVITGSPGCGKTEVGKILAKLYYTLGIAKKDKFTLAKRSDLIGKYLGHTAKMTQDVFNKAKGGILFIDEAYSLGNPEGRDSFSKECIDTINQNLTENKDTVVFIAGYKKQLEESFFAYNPGLHRRFKFRVEVDKYDATELRLIYIKKLKDSKWDILNNDAEKSIPLKLFEKNREIFKFNGGDMENLWHQTQIVHSRRIFGKSRDLLRKINEDDVKNAIETYLENDEVKKRNNDIKKYIQDTIYI